MADYSLVKLTVAQVKTFIFRGRRLLSWCVFFDRGLGIFEWRLAFAAIWVVLTEKHFCIWTSAASNNWVGVRSRTIFWVWPIFSKFLFLRLIINRMIVRVAWTTHFHLRLSVSILWFGCAFTARGTPQNLKLALIFNFHFYHRFSLPERFFPLVSISLSYVQNLKILGKIAI